MTEYYVWNMEYGWKLLNQISHFPKSNVSFCVHGKQSRDEMIWDGRRHRRHGFKTIQNKSNEMMRKKNDEKKCAGGNARWTIFELELFEEFSHSLRHNFYRRPFSRTDTNHRSINALFGTFAQPKNLIIFFSLIHPFLCASNPSFKMQF